VELLNAASSVGVQSFVRRRLATVAACVLTLAAVSAPAQTPPLEYGVKATYLYKFAPFIEWPAGTFASASDPLVICVVGSDPVADLVDEAVKGQVISAHAIDVRHLEGSARGARCHILYIALRGPAAAGALDSVRGTPVLTVTDSARDAGGIVNFVVQDNHVRFEINLHAAAENHLVISSKLLNLATRVSPKP